MIANAAATTAKRGRREQEMTSQARPDNRKHSIKFAETAFYAGAYVALSALAATLIIVVTATLTPHHLPEAPQATTPISVEPLPTHTATETLHVTTKHKDRHRMIALLKHDVQQHGGYIIEETSEERSSHITLTVAAPSEYIQRLAPIASMRNTPDKPALQRWAKLVNSEPRPKPNGRVSDTLLDVTVNPSVLNNQAERQAMTATGIAMVAGFLVALGSLVVAKLQHR